MSRRLLGRTRARSLRLASGRASGFTLVEMLVAIGAVAFVAVGIASIFASVGDTVSQGRSVSAITQYAAVLERQMREDFANMTRDGYLIIRHEDANEGNPVPLFPGQINARERRIDEIMFFTSTPSRSAREPFAPGYVAEGSSARVYYGMGQRLTEDLDPNSQFLEPDIVDENRTTGEEERLGFSGSWNEFASDWTLLRHETTLVIPGGSLGDDPGIAGLTQAQWADNRLQIALQPAAESIFRSVNRMDTSSCTDRFPDVEIVRTVILGSGDPNVSGVFESGLVDVATTSLEEIRAVVEASPGIVQVGFGSPAEFVYASPVEVQGDCVFYQGLGLAGNGVPVGPVGVQQAWMLNGLPAPSHEFDITFNPGTAVPAGEEFSTYNAAIIEPPDRSRIRYEFEPPDIFGPLTLAGDESAIRLADQYALSASGFIPRVSEFIVEWSFGKLDDEGRLIWHGRERGIDVDKDGTDDQFVLPYPQYQSPLRSGPTDPAPRAGAFFVPYELRNPAVAGSPGVGDDRLRFNTDEPTLDELPGAITDGDFADAGDFYGSYPVYPQLIHGVEVSGAPADAATVSYFGYTIPFFNPDDPDGDSASASASTADAALDDTLAWPWPELVRVTVSLVDPGDETIERTFQYVFPTPGNPVR